MKDLNDYATMDRIDTLYGNSCVPVYVPCPRCKKNNTECHTDCESYTVLTEDVF